MFRLDALNAFELGQDLSQRNGYLPQVPTGAEILRGAGYYTSHSGKISYIETNLGLTRMHLGQDLSQRNGYLPQVPTGAEILRGAGYYTSHSGNISYIENLNGER